MRLEELIQSTQKVSRKELKKIFAKGLVRVDDQIERNISRNVDSNLHQISLNQRLLTTKERYYISSESI